MPKEVKYRITADNKSAKGLKGAEKDLNRFQKATRRIGASIRSMFVITMGDVVRVVQGAFRFMSESIRAFGRQQAAERDLAASFEYAGAAAEANVPRIKALASAIQQLTIHGDEAVIAAASMGLNLGVGADQIDRVTVAAIGLHKKLSMEGGLGSAMKLLARASQGAFELFSKYGIILDENMTDQEKFNYVLGLGADAFALARAEGDTLLGDMEQMSSAWSDFREQIGDSALEIAGGADGLDGLTQKVKDLTAAARESTPALKKLWGFFRKQQDIIETGLGINAMQALIARVLGVGKGTNVDEADAAAQNVVDDAVSGTGGGGGAQDVVGGAAKTVKRARIGLSQAFDIARGEAGPNTSPELSLLQSIDDRLESMDGKL